MAAGNQDMILSIVNEGFGFDIDEINTAIKALGNEAAIKANVIAFLFEARHQTEKRKSESGKQMGSQVAQANKSAKSSKASSNAKSKASASSNSKASNGQAKQNAGFYSKPAAKKRASLTGKVAKIGNGIKQMDLNSPPAQAVQQTSFDPSKENISGKGGTESVKQMLMDQAKQRQKEKAELAAKNRAMMEKEMQKQKKKEFAEREHQKKVEEQKQKMQQRRQKNIGSKRTNKKKNHSAFLEKQAKYMDEVQKAESDMKTLDDNRAEKEEKINTPEQAIHAMVEEYGKEEAGHKLMYVRRLLLKILNGPKDLSNPLNRQLRTFDYKDQTVLVNIVTPFGPKIFLATVGFEERQLVKNKNDPVMRTSQTFLLLPNKSFDIKKIQAAFEALNKFLDITSLQIHSIIYKECFKKEEISANSLFYGTWLLYTAVVNTMRDPMAENARAVDKVSFPNSVLESKNFSGLIKTMGFKEHALVHGSKYKLHYAIEKGNWRLKEFSDKGKRMLLVNGERLYDVLVLLLPYTTLGGAVYGLIQSNVNKNNKTKINKFLKSTLNFVTKRMNESLDHKNDHIDLNKVKEKCPNMLDKEGKENGIENLLSLLDFEKPDALGSMYSTNTSKKGIGMAQIRRKQIIFEFSVNYYSSL